MGSRHQSLVKNRMTYSYDNLPKSPINTFTHKQGPSLGSNFFSPSKASSISYLIKNQPATTSNSCIGGIDINSPSLNRTIQKVVHKRPQSAFRNVKIMRIGDPSGVNQKSNLIKKYMEPEEAMISKLKELTNNKKSVNLILGKLFYVQQKKQLGVDLDPTIVINHTLHEQSQKKLSEERKVFLKNKIISKIKESENPHQEDLTKKDRKPEVSDKYVRFKKKHRPLQLLKAYAITQRETLEKWNSVHGKGNYISHNLINTFFKKDDPAQMILDSQKYIKNTRTKSRKQTKEAARKSQCPDLRNFPNFNY